jgi:hypothetical protein
VSRTPPTIAAPIRIAGSGCSCWAAASPRSRVASELAQRGAARVVVASRRQRYVIQKLLAGVPADHVAFTRFAALAAESFPPAASEAGLRALVVGTSGSPEQFGAPRPADSLFAAGLTLSQQFLPLVADGRIAVRPWVARLAGEMAHFADGGAEPFDAIVLATGYTPALPFLGADVRAALGLGDAPAESVERVDRALYDLTFHPALPGSRSWVCSSRSGRTCRRSSCRRAGSPMRGAAA